MNAWPSPRAPKRDDAPYLGEGQSQTPGLRDEVEHAEDIAGIRAISRGCALGRRKNTARLVQPQRLAAHAAARRDLADEQRTSLHEDRIGLPPRARSRSDLSTGGFLTQSNTAMYRPPMVAAPSTYRQLLCLGIATVAVLTLLGHVCVVPWPVDAATVPFADSHHRGPDSAPDGSHATLCEGMVAKTGAGTTLGVLHAAAPPSFESAVMSVLALSERPRESFASRADVSPPLFLLHSSFRI